MQDMETISVVFTGSVITVGFGKIFAGSIGHKKAGPLLALP
jgi:hypothetical protein